MLIIFFLHPHLTHESFEQTCLILTYRREKVEAGSAPLHIK